MADEQQALEEFTRQIQEAGGATSDMIKTMEEANGSMKRHMVKSAKDLGGGVKSFAGSVLNGNKSFDSMIPIVDSLGKAMSGLVGAVPMVGGSLAKLAEGTTEAAKFMIGQLSKQVGTFQDVSKSGALAAGGMETFSKSAFSSLMSLEAFGRVVSENGKTLAMMNGSTAKGVKTFGDLTKVLNNDDSFRRLGYTANEMADTTAGYLKQQTRLGMTQSMGQEQLLGSTTRYIKELDILGRLTGENRKEMANRIEGLKLENAFSAYLGNMSAKEADAMTALVASLGPLGDGFKEYVLKGGAVVTDAGQNFALMAGRTGLEMEKVARETGNIPEAMKLLQDRVSPDQLEQRRGFARLDVDSVFNQNFAAWQALSRREILNREDYQSEQDLMLSGVDKVSTGMAKAGLSIDKFTANLNETILKAMPLTASIVAGLAKVMEDVSKMAADFGKGEPDPAKPSWFNSSGRTSAVGSTGNLALDSINAMDKKASGGPVKAGEPYIVGEEGPEMFMPKVAGDIIPNHLSMGPKSNPLGMGTVSSYADEREREAQVLEIGSQLGWDGNKGIAFLDQERYNDINDFVHGTQSYSGSLTAPMMGNTAGPKLSRVESGANLANYLKTFETDTAQAKEQQVDKALEAELLSDTPSKTTEDKEQDRALMAQQNSKLDELVRLMGKHIAVSEGTRSALM